MYFQPYYMYQKSQEHEVFYVLQTMWNNYSIWK